LLAALLMLSMTAITASAEADKVITIWHLQSQDIQKVAFEQAKERFEAANPGYKVDITVYQNDAYKTKIQVALAAGEAPDIFPSWSGGPMIEYVNAGLVTDLTKLMTDSGLKDKLMDGAVAQATYDGKIWGVPLENVSVALVYYNKAVFEKCGVQVPTTLAELEAACDKFKAAGVVPFALANATKWTGSMYYMYLVDRYGGSKVFANAASKAPDGFMDPAFVKAGETIQKWVKAGYFNEGFNGMDEDNGQSRMLLYSGQAAMYLMGSWAISTFQSENPDFLKNMGVFAFPSVEGGAGDPTAVVGTVGDNFYHINAKCAYPEMAFKYLETCLDEQGVAYRLSIGKIPPIKGVQVSDPNLQMVLDIVNKAASVQLWYDQYMSSKMAEVHKDTCQALFGLTMTPEEVCKAMQDAINAE
jgi:raffinose/stachyose/melibiose transport system substrate-binding protein